MNVHTVELDVRPQLRNKSEPFDLIMGAIKKLNKEDVFVLHATLKPTPLLGIMRLKGYHNKVEKLADDHYVTTFVHKSQKHLLDDSTLMSDEAASDSQDDVEATSESAQQHEAVTGAHRLIELDNRGLEPPQPMVRTLAQLEKMDRSDVLVITNDRVPAFLIEELKQRGCTYEVEMLGEGEQARITIRKP